MLQPLNYKNLDEVPEFKGENTTTEFLTKHIFDRLADAARDGRARPRRPRAEGDPRHHLRSRMWRGRGTRRRCGEARRVRGAGRSCDADRRLCLRPPHDRGIAASWAGRSTCIGLGDGFPRPSAAAKAAARATARRRAGGLSDRDRRAGVRRAAGGGARAARAQSAGRAGASSAGAGNRTCRQPTRPRCETSERDALAAARGVVVTSPSTARLLVDDYGVPPDRITVARPGHRSRRHRATAAATASCGLLAVGSVVPRKGYDVLIAALAR